MTEINHPRHLGLPGVFTACGTNKAMAVWTDRDADVTCERCLQYRHPGHSHTIGSVCTPETCTGHPKWQEIRGELPHSRACGLFCQGHGTACSKDCPTCGGKPYLTATVTPPDPDSAQGRADQIQQRRVSELQAELAAMTQRAEHAEAVVAGVQSALETLFAAVPRRMVLPMPDAADLEQRALDPRQIMILPEPAVVQTCNASPMCEAAVHLLACPRRVV
jgi:hypothetical protein